MSLSNTTTTQTYVGDSTVTLFPLPFEYQDDDQIQVTLTNSVTGSSTIGVNGVDYTIDTTASPSVYITPAPASTISIKIDRVTVKTQIYHYLTTGRFRVEDHEAALDRIVMMIQEIYNNIVSPTVSGTGQFIRLGAQSVASGGIVTVSSTQPRIIKAVRGATTFQTCDATTPLAAGLVDLQELRLVGYSDDQALTIPNSGNMALTADMVMGNFSVLDLYWDATLNNWIETSRR